QHLISNMKYFALITFFTVFLVYANAAPIGEEATGNITPLGEAIRGATGETGTWNGAVKIIEGAASGVTGQLKSATDGAKP
ncbi:hypothetical protein BGZ95_002155, partial [Linnemannia exigua]